MRERQPASGSCGCVPTGTRSPAKYGQISRTFRGTQRAASEALARLVTEVKDGHHGGTSATVAVMLEHWISHLETQGRAPKTIEGYQSLIRARLEPGLGSIRLDRLSPADLDRFYRALLDAGLSRMSIRHCHAAMSTALRQAVKWGWIDRSPADRASPPPVRSTEIKPPAVADITTLLRHLDTVNPDLASMVYVAATTGCRRGELCGLKWADIDHPSQSLTVRRSISDTNLGVTEKDPKTHRSRRIALDPSTGSVLGGAPAADGSPGGFVRVGGDG